ncbi:hypothetical protein OF83DRAFT_1175707 [Amylostereum chailletii]|nr:hypothetical protein OF83DRAFT_1175707 [Amylostereum chailletii]
MPIRPYGGPRRRLVLAFDVGTAFSHVSYAILEPDRVPELKTVVRYVRQGPAKPIQTVVYYAATGKAFLVAGEAPSEEGGGPRPWKVERFKLLLFPTSTATNGITHPTLPPSKTIVDVYADFYPFLLQCASTHIRMTHVDGDRLWESIQDDVAFVLSHPRGWGAEQHKVMRRAAVRGRLVPDTPEGRARITFVAEGEASLHYQALAWGFFSEETKTCRNFMVIDAGRMTVDLATYATASDGSSATNMKELAQPTCIFEGIEFVRERISRHLKGKLLHSRFGTEEYLGEIIRQFRRVNMREYRGFSELSVKFSNDRTLRDKKVGIKDGRMKLSNHELRVLFDPSFEAIVRAIKQQQTAAGQRIGTYLLIGSFAESEYLYNELRSLLGSSGYHLNRPNLPSKAVAEGSILNYLSSLESAPQTITGVVGGLTADPVQVHPPSSPSGAMDNPVSVAATNELSSSQLEQCAKDGPGSTVTFPPHNLVSSSDEPTFISVASLQEDTQSSDGSADSMGTLRSDGSLIDEATWIPATSTTSDASTDERPGIPPHDAAHEARLRDMTERAEENLRVQAEVMGAALPPRLYLSPPFGGGSSGPRSKFPFFTRKTRGVAPVPSAGTRALSESSTIVAQPANKPTLVPYGQMPSPSALPRPLPKDVCRPSIQVSRPRRGSLTLDELGRPISDFEHHGWRLYTGLQTGPEYFHHPDLRVVTNLDLRAVDVLDHVREFLDGGEEESADGGERGWKFERVWVHHKTRMVSFKYPEQQHRDDVEMNQSRSTDVERVYWSYVEAHAAHVSLSREVVAEAKALLDLHILDSIGRPPALQSSALSTEECQSLKQFLQDLDAPILTEYPILYTRKLAKVMLKISNRLTARDNVADAVISLWM